MFAAIADLVAFIHLFHWPVVEPERMKSVLAHLEAIPPLSRENWRRILAETDSGKEWIPNPRQTGMLPGVTVTQEQIDGWMLFLDEFEALLKGEKLLPHWRFRQGHQPAPHLPRADDLRHRAPDPGFGRPPLSGGRRAHDRRDLAADRRASRRQLLRLRALVQLTLSDAGRSLMWIAENRRRASPFGRKVKIAAALCGLDDRIKIEVADTTDPTNSLRRQNPLGKIPALILEDGTALYDSARHPGIPRCRGRRRGDHSERAARVFAC